eukprot:Platyproteum_vivax@DN14972_c0_g1_i1.p1
MNLDLDSSNYNLDSLNRKDAYPSSTKGMFDLHSSAAPPSENYKKEEAYDSTTWSYGDNSSEYYLNLECSRILNQKTEDLGQPGSQKWQQAKVDASLAAIRALTARTQFLEGQLIFAQKRHENSDLEEAQAKTERRSLIHKVEDLEIRLRKCKNRNAELTSKLERYQNADAENARLTAMNLWLKKELTLSQKDKDELQNAYLKAKAALDAYTSGMADTVKKMSCHVVYAQAASENLA